MSLHLGTHRNAWARLLDRASAPYRGAGRFAWHFARGKLGHDPVFRHLLATGQTRVVLMSAPAGYGKTALLEAWASAEARPMAWVTVQREPGGEAVGLERRVVRHLAADVAERQPVDRARDAPDGLAVGADLGVAARAALDLEHAQPPVRVPAVAQARDELLARIAALRPRHRALVEAGLFELEVGDVMIVVGAADELRRIEELFAPGERVAG